MFYQKQNRSHLDLATYRLKQLRTYLIIISINNCIIRRRITSTYLFKNEAKNLTGHWWWLIMTFKLHKSNYFVNENELIFNRKQLVSHQYQMTLRYDLSDYYNATHNVAKISPVFNKCL